MNPDVGQFDGDGGPDGSDDPVAADDLSRMPDQNDQYVERPAAERDRLAAFEQEPLRRQKLEGPESEYPLRHDTAPPRYVYAALRRFASIMSTRSFNSG
ncbi:MAG TPA: hypothetical protein VNE67_11585 [Acetobacteraceae bacterium]|nr:hypothetical protein [Acetobacteraceae bacterium]